MNEDKNKHMHFRRQKFPQRKTSNKMHKEHLNKSKSTKNVIANSIAFILISTLIGLIASHQTSLVEASLLTPVGSSSSVTPVTPIQVQTGGASGQELPPSDGNLAVSHKSSLLSRQSSPTYGDMVNDIQIECNSDNIVVTLNTNHGFNGMIYPKGLSKNSTCMNEYHQTTQGQQHSSNITYYLPLRSCNTMSSDVEDGVEYFNTVMVQPHRRLVTNQGRGYHIRCRYQTKERTITNQETQLNVNLNHSTPAVIGSAQMPTCSMKIYSSNDLSHEVAAENVRIGDELHLVISLDEPQDVYGMLVTNCLVRDGMNWGEQPLLDDYGCPVDEEIMPQFVYAQNLTRASVTFQAHKFPYTPSVYYQCNVRLCFRDGGGCNHVPPTCDKFNGAGNSLGSRHKRWVDGGELDAVASEEVKQPTTSTSDKRSMSIEVYSGLHVDESEPEAAAAAAASTSDDKDPIMMASTSDEPQTVAAQQTTNSNSKKSDRDFCITMRKFAIAISLASILLMLFIIIIIACMIQRRKRRKFEEDSAQHHHHHHANAYDYQQHQHQAYPYSNRGYCRD